MPTLFFFIQSFFPSFPADPQFQTGELYFLSSSSQASLFYQRSNLNDHHCFLSFALFCKLFFLLPPSFERPLTLWISYPSFHFFPFTILLLPCMLLSLFLFFCFRKFMAPLDCYLLLMRGSETTTDFLSLSLPHSPTHTLLSIEKSNIVCLEYRIELGSSAGQKTSSGAQDALSLSLLCSFCPAF